MPALNMTAAIPHRFRSYRVRKHQTFNCKIWEAARATSAAPTFFKRIEIGDPGSSKPYIDGGMGCNNPITQVLDEAELVFSTRKVACIVSVGTGKAETIAIPKPTWFQQVLPLDVVGALRGIATDCEHSAQEVARRFQGMPNVYFRFNVEQGMQTIGLGQWEQLDGVATHTDQYMRVQDVDQNLDSAVSAIRERRALIPTVQIGMEAPRFSVFHALNPLSVS
jgi:predicted acylesterase/phospholipase RssA